MSPSQQLPLLKSSTVNEFDTVDPEQDSSFGNSKISPIKAASTDEQNSIVTTAEKPSFQIIYLTQEEEEKAKEENENEKDNFLDKLNVHKSIIRYSQLESTDNHRADQIPSESIEPIENVENEETDYLNKTLESEKEAEKQANESFELNTSSISQNSELAATKKDDIVGEKSDDNDKTLFQLPEEAAPRLSRTNSESSLFSQISSVSEHWEKLKKDEDSTKKS